jgi:hypothetical protein
MFFAFISNLGPNNKPQIVQSWPQVFSALIPSVKWALVLDTKYIMWNKWEYMFDISKSFTFLRKHDVYDHINEPYSRIMKYLYKKLEI